MVRPRNRHLQEDTENMQDLRLQKNIFLGTFTLMIIFLISLYLQISLAFSGIVAAVLLISTGIMYVKYKDFYTLRDRGQRTWCVTISMYASLLLTLGCVYYFTQDAPLTDDYALVFLFGFMFFTYMVYRTLSPTMVVGNKRRRIKN